MDWPFRDHGAYGVYGAYAVLGAYDCAARSHNHLASFTNWLPSSFTIALFLYFSGDADFIKMTLD